MFGNNAHAYQKGRQGFPLSVINFVIEQSKNSKPKILDLGCGTGISSRQLSSRSGGVCGLDIDDKMIDVATDIGSHIIDYKVGSAHNIPFSEHSFDLVTAFSAFHWFSDANALHEIARVLKPDCRFVAVNKRELGTFEIELRAILQPFALEALPEPKVGYDPISIIENSGGFDIRTFSIDVVESYDREAARHFLKSQSIFNLVELDKRKCAEEALLCWAEQKILTL